MKKAGAEGSSDFEEQRPATAAPEPPTATAGDETEGNNAKARSKGSSRRKGGRVVYSPYPGRATRRGVTASDAAAAGEVQVQSSLPITADDNHDGDDEREAVASSSVSVHPPDDDDHHRPAPSPEVTVVVAVDDEHELDLSESYAVTDAGLLGRHVASFLSISEALEDPDVTDSEDGVELTYRYHLTGPEHFWGGGVGGVGMLGGGGAIGGGVAGAAMDAVNAQEISSSPIPPFVGGGRDEVVVADAGAGARVDVRFCTCGGGEEGGGREDVMDDYFSDDEDDDDDDDGEDYGDVEDESSMSAHDHRGRDEGGGGACCAQSKSQSSKESDDNTPPDVAPVTPPEAARGHRPRPRHWNRDRHRHHNRPSAAAAATAASRHHRMLDARNLRRERKRELQRHIGHAVLSNPVSVRSYCLSARAKAQRLRLTERQHRQRLFLMSSTSSSAGNNNNNNNNNNNSRSTSRRQKKKKKRGRRSRRGGGGGGICAHCGLRRRRSGRGGWSAPSRSPSPSSSSSCCSTSPSSPFQRGGGNAVWAASESSSSPPSSPFKPLRPVLDRILQNVALSVFLQIADGAVDTSIGVCLSAYKISAGAVHLVVSVTCETVGGTWNSAVSAVVAHRHRLLNPWAAADFATEVLASGIQSVAEGVGSTRKSASAAIQHYLHHGHHHHAKNKSAHAAAHHHNAAVGKVGGVAGKKGHGHNLSSRSGAASFFGFVKMSGRRVQNVNNAISDKLFRRLSRVDSTSRVISYTEMADEVLTQQAKQRVQRMMHYDVSLKPFVATVMAPPTRPPPALEDGGAGTWGGGGGEGGAGNKRSPRPPRGGGLQPTGATREQQRGASAAIAAGAVAPETFSNFDFMGASSSSLSEMVRVQPGGGGGGGGGGQQLQGDEVGRAALQTSPTADMPMGGGGAGGASDDDGEDDSSYTSSSSSSSTITSNSSPFMCTPKSFPPSPSARSLVMARGTRFAEDVVFLARDQLRVEGGLASTNDRTRSVAMSLREGRRLAVFSAEDAGSGIALTCGQHCATKVGTSLYCSTRCMVPVMRNCHVYFEMSVSTPSGNILHHASTMSSLAIGLSTLEMTHNTLVGAWKSSVGLCTTGQILSAGQWFSPNDPRFSAYGNNSTVGCLVRIDDDSAIETWDGVMLTASVTFNVDGHLVVPPVCVAPVGVGSGSVLAAMGAYNGDVGAGAVGGRGGFAVGGGAGELLNAGMPSASLPLFVPREEELFPTLTLHSPGTYVMCRFCAQDILAKTRESIGAPKGVTVYAVDGSILFEEDVDRRRYSSSSSSSSGGGENADGDKDISPVDSAATENDISPVDSMADQSEATACVVRASR